MCLETGDNSELNITLLGEFIADRAVCLNAFYIIKHVSSVMEIFKDKQMSPIFFY